MVMKEIGMRNADREVLGSIEGNGLGLGDERIL